MKFLLITISRYFIIFDKDKYYIKSNKKISVKFINNLINIKSQKKTSNSIKI